MKDSEKKTILQKVYDLAHKYETERGSCPQCILAALKETLNIGNAAIIQAADTLAGGCTLTTQGTCGALVGGLLAIGSFTGRTYGNFSEAGNKRRGWQYSKMLYDKFLSEYGSSICKDVHLKLFGRTFNLLDPQDYKDFLDAGGHKDKCPPVAGNVARWAAEIILDHLRKE